MYDANDYESSVPPSGMFPYPDMNGHRRIMQQGGVAGTAAASRPVLDVASHVDPTGIEAIQQVDHTPLEGGLHGAVRKLLGGGQADKGSTTGDWGGYTIPSLAATGKDDLSQFQVGHHPAHQPC